MVEKTQDIQFKKAIYPRDLDFSIAGYRDWHEFFIEDVRIEIRDLDFLPGHYREWSNDFIDDVSISVPFSSLEKQYLKLQKAGGFDADGNVIQNHYMKVEVAKELVMLYQFCKENKVDVVIL